MYRLYRLFMYRHEHEDEAPRASCPVYCIKHEDFSCYNYITTTPYPTV